MVKGREKTVDEILSNLEPGRKEITEKFRSMVKNTIPDATGIVRRGRITYILNGKDLVNQLILYNNYYYYFVPVLNPVSSAIQS